MKLEGSIPCNSGHSIHIFGAIAQDNFFKIEALGSAILWQRKHPVFTNGLCLLKEGKITFCWSDWSKQCFPTSS